MDTKDLRCFCRVYEERGINQAAKQLFISPQGLSRIITKLEAELQVTLFCRSARGLSPTASGTYLYENGRELLNRLEELEIGIRRMERIDRELQLGFSCGVLNVFPFQQLDQFKSENPDIHLQWEELENQEVMDRILRRVVDVGFVIGYHSFLSRCKDFGFIPLIHIKLMESQLIYRFCREKLGIGIDTNIHKQDISMEHLHRVKLYDAFSWKISIVCREDRKKEKLIKKLLDQF